MVCDMFLSRLLTYGQCVLILILLEYGLRPYFYAHKEDVDNVLILILLEYGLRPSRVPVQRAKTHTVLILILLEYGLRQS